MENITGKSLIFTDVHLGLRSGSISRLNIVVNAFKEIVKTIKEEDIKNVFFLGDAFHSRVSLDVNVINVGLALFGALAKRCRMYMIVGNHDSHLKNAININSLNMFKENKNIVIVSSPYELNLNGQSVLLLPWLSDLSKYKAETYDIMMGHFEINDKYLIASYIEEHSKTPKNKAAIDNIIDEDDLLNGIQTSTNDINEQVNDIVTSKTKSNELIGDFIEIVKKDGLVYSGHIHNHKEFVSKQRQFVFVGSPYQQNFGEIDSVDGFYVLDEKNTRRFIETKTVPIHKKIYMSDILNAGIDNYDFSQIRGNIIQKIYDIDIDRNIEAKINQKITDFNPYEEMLPEYNVVPSALDNGTVSSESLDMIKKSKLDYIKNYIDNIDDEALKENQLEKEKLFSILEAYYNKVIESQNI